MSGPDLDDFLDFQTNLPEVDVEVFEDVGGDPGALLLTSPRRMVFRADVFRGEAAEPPGWLAAFTLSGAVP